MKPNKQADREEIENDVFHGIPPKAERKHMSAEKLAILLSECEKATPKYILISHELSLRIIKEQNKITIVTGLGAALIGLLGIVIGALLSWC